MGLKEEDREKGKNTIRKEGGVGQEWGNSLNCEICSYLHLCWKRAVAMTTSGPAISDHEFQGLGDAEKTEEEPEKRITVL